MIGVLALLAVQATQVSQDQIVAGWWRLHTSAEYKMCTLAAPFTNGEYLAVTYYAGEKTAVMAFTEKDATSLKEGDKRKIDIIFEINRQLDDGWTDTEFETSVEDDGSRHLNSEDLEAVFLDDFAKARAVEFRVGKTKIAAYNLRNSAQGVTALRNCAMRAAGLNPKDPFAR